MESCERSGGQYEWKIPRSPPCTDKETGCGWPAKLQPKFVGPNCIVEVLLNYTDSVEHSGQTSVQNEQQLKF